jgi:hypothetical protein
MSDFTQEVNCKIGGVIKVDYGTYVIDEPLLVRSSIIIDPGTTFITNGFKITMTTGSNWTSSVGVHSIVKNGLDHLFLLAGTQLEVKGLITNEQSSTGGYTFLIDTSTSRDRIKISNVQTYHSRGLIADDGQSGIVVGLQMEDVKARQHRGRASYLTRCYAYTSLTRCTADYINTTSLALANTPAWTILNSQGLLLDYGDVTGNATSGSMAGQLGLYLENCDATTIQQFMADTVGSHGVYIRNCRNTEISILKSGLTGGYPLVVTGGSINTNVSLGYLAGRYGLPNDGNSVPIWTDGTTINTSVQNLNLDRFNIAYNTQSFPGVFVGRVSQT